ncbi:MAG: KpsF/GutQ family sugar-phosphate isomerase [Aquificaceae bacterium]|nr:KpsF/GutQ family sugar-phosphate isomerase [Aquificaceae bacterium]MDW8237782.1 KpsF/GutQ family sugar-phosphate isomerase [Aquificaceae bacterium]
MNSSLVIQKAQRVFDIEISALKNLRDRIDFEFEKAVNILISCNGKIITTGVGKSGHVAKKVASTLSSTGAPAVFLHPSEALHGELGTISQEDVMLAFSSSGESQEVLSLVPYAKRLNIPLISITNNKDSTLAKLSDVHLCLYVEKEACPLALAPTSTSTASMVLGDALAMVLLELKNFTPQDFAIRHPGGSLGRKLKQVRDLCHTGDNLPMVSEDASLLDAIMQMTGKGFGATAVVNSEGKLTGIITDGDLRRFFQKHKELKDSKARDAMTKNPKTTTMDELAVSALRRMEEHKITVLIVIDNSVPIGIIHMHDILRAKVV